MNTAKTAALILAMAPFLAVAQRPDGHLERKPSPATSAASAPMPQSGVAATPAPQRPNPNLNAVPRQIQSVPVQPAMRPASSVPANSIASPAVQPSATIAQPVVTPAPPSEPTAAVNYAQGQLTVVSQNASLGSLMKLISARTGAVIDLAPELQNEPVIAQIGPSPVREVMTALLDSPKIDYIIMGSGNASGGLERVLVRTRQSFGRNVVPMNRPEQPAPAATEFRLNGGAPAAGVAKPQTALTQEQLMENWKKIREEKKQAEIAQQQQDRENEANHVEPPPQPEEQPQPTNTVPDNPPLQ